MQGAFRIEKIRKMMVSSIEPITIRATFERAGVVYTVVVDRDNAWLFTPRTGADPQKTRIWYGHRGAPIPSKTIAELKRQLKIVLKEVNDFYIGVLEEHVPEAMFDVIVNGKAPNFARKILEYQNKIIETHRETIKMAFADIPADLGLHDTKFYEEGDLKGSLRMEGQSDYAYLYWRGSKRVFCNALKDIELQVQRWCALAQILIDAARKQSA